MSPEAKFDDRQLHAQLFELRELMALCLAWVDALPLNDVAPHLDLAIARLDQSFARRANLVSPPEMIQ
ncbi:MAG: hypothetical protein JWO25_3522 [Alphaproteobacteria bacterium]|nr:hypothetical protein [Alphaproteobacteria bacterium]MDB5722066.1 hypothetical protein [Alphaproteobacteria bacterium]